MHSNLLLIICQDGIEKKTSSIIMRKNSNASQEAKHASIEMKIKKFFELFPHIHNDLNQ
jgi:hypothetical protein